MFHFNGFLNDGINCLKTINHQLPTSQPTKPAWEISCIIGCIKEVIWTIYSLLHFVRPVTQRNEGRPCSLLLFSLKRSVYIKFFHPFAFFCILFFSYILYNTMSAIFRPATQSLKFVRVSLHIIPTLGNLVDAFNFIVILRICCSFRL